MRVPWNRHRNAVGQEQAGELVVRDLEVLYGRSPALHEVSIQVAPAEAVAILGPNGAGKTTLISAVSGIVTARHGEIRYGDQDLCRVSAADRVKLGLVHVPEGRRIFAGMSVLDNLKVGAGVRSDRRTIDDDIEELLGYFPLKDKLQCRGRELSGGQQQMLAIARALMSRPNLLMLDEPSLGLSPLLVTQMTELIGKIQKERSVSVLLAEQNASVAIDVADRLYVLTNGSVIHESTSESAATGLLLDVYLGSGSADHKATRSGDEALS